MNEGLFQSVNAALQFAYNYQGSPVLSVMNRMGQVSGAVLGKGLAGVDGAAQAGMIKRHVASLGKFPEALIIAEFAPRTYPCSCRSLCCLGYTRNQQWSDAVNNIADIVRIEALGEYKTTHPIRRACVEKFFGCSVTQTRMAETLDIHESTLSRMIGKVRRYLTQQQDQVMMGLEDALKCVVSKIY